jgi:L-glutamine:2-deoxy-scyllo-inosose/3-amino-2,3-dideoxy-scyllo-inosose aminotransferase
MKLAIDGGSPVRSTKDAHVQWPVWGEEEKANLQEVVESGVWSYSGPFERRLLSEWQEYVGTNHALAAANGTVTLQIALEALGIGYGDEVILPGLTWQATAAVVVDVNAVPILVDVEPDTWCIDPVAVEAAITERTAAIIVVHLYGNMPDMDRILDIANRHNLPVIEDSAHQHGAEWNGKKTGSLGTIGSFSLQLSKVLTAGEGGLLTTDDQDLWVRMDALRNCGRRPETDDDAGKGAGVYATDGDLIQSGNYRITEFQAAILVAGLKRLDTQNSQRERLAARLDDYLETVSGLSPMKRDPRQTRRAYFNWAFRYDADSFGGGGIATATFRRALSAELSTDFEQCYEPLNDCTLYRPRTKKRYRINESHWAAIDPSRFHLPVCSEAFISTSVTTHHSFLLGGEAAYASFVTAIEKLIASAERLRRAD